jgi:hypothetical protein
MFQKSEGAGQKSSEELLCTGCKHRLVSHGNLPKIKTEHLDKVVIIVLQIEHHSQEATRATDPAKRQKHLEVVAQMKQ